MTDAGMNRVMHVVIVSAVVAFVAFWIWKAGLWP